MLGRSVGISDEQLAHLTADTFPDGLFAPDEAALVRFAQVSTREIRISDECYDELATHLENLVAEFTKQFQPSAQSER